MSTSPLFIRRSTEGRTPLCFYIDGEEHRALEGDTILTALLTQRTFLRTTERTQTPRAGFCLMGVCQDCIVRIDAGKKVRACSTLVSTNMNVYTITPGTVS